MMTIKQIAKQKLDERRGDFIVKLKKKLDKCEKSGNDIPRVMSELIQFYRQYIADICEEITIGMQKRWAELKKAEAKSRGNGHYVN